MLPFSLSLSACLSLCLFTQVFVSVYIVYAAIMLIYAFCSCKLKTLSNFRNKFLLLLLLLLLFSVAQLQNAQ